MKPEALAQQHRQRENLAGGIGAIGAGEVEGGAVIGLIDGVAGLVVIAGEGRAARSEQGRAEISQDVAEQVRRGDHVENLRLADQPVSHQVDVDHAVLDAVLLGGVVGAGLPQPADRGDAGLPSTPRSNRRVRSLAKRAAACMKRRT